MVTTTFEGEAFAQDSGKVYLVLLEISHADLTSTIRVVNNNENITSNSNTFVKFPFDITLPDNKNGSPSAAKLAIDNVSFEISDAIRSISTPATVKIQVVDAANPNTIEVEFPNFLLTNVNWDVNSVSGDLTQEDFFIEPFPAGTFSPNAFPSVL